MFDGVYFLQGVGDKASVGSLVVLLRFEQKKWDTLNIRLLKRRAEMLEAVSTGLHSAAEKLQFKGVSERGCGF